MKGQWIAGITFLWALASDPCSAVAQKFDIQMVVWRGATRAEDTFVHYVVSRGLTDSVKTWDAAQNLDQLREIRQQIAAHPPDLLYLFGTTVALAFAGTAEGPEQPETQALRAVPMIFNIVADPVGSGLTRDYNATHRNLTGVSHAVPLPVQARVINDLGVKQVAALFNPAEKNSAATLKTLSDDLLGYQIRLTQVPVSAPQTQASLPPVNPRKHKRHKRALTRTESVLVPTESWAALAERLSKSGTELVYLPSDSLVISHAQEIVAALHQAHLPTFSATEDPITQGGALMGVISHYSAAGLHAAVVAERILRQGIPAGDIPIATPNGYLFEVNEKSMKQLNYYPPIPLLRFAEFIAAAAPASLTNTPPIPANAAAFPHPPSAPGNAGH